MEKNMAKTLIIVGGGASGITCAIVAKRSNPDMQITILEKNDRIGKKILKTGNGKCNISNLDVHPSHYNNPLLLQKWFEMLPLEEVIDFLKSLGLFLKTDGSTRLYPYSEQATSVLEVLRYELDRLHIEIVCGVEVQAIEKKQKFVLTTNQRTYEADFVVMATGSIAQEKTKGYQIIEKLGHSTTAIHPGLVALKTKEKLKSLQGLRVKTRASIYKNNKLLFADEGEILFKEDGLSGILAFDLSRYASEDCLVSLDLLPDHPELLQELSSLLKWKELEPALLGILPKMIVWDILKKHANHDLKAIVKTIHHYEFDIIGTYGFEFAQIVCGGISVDEINDDFSSKKVSNLFIVGEILDIDGASGGYNLHFAWLSGMIAGRVISHF